jgi:hypothetical protein
MEGKQGEVMPKHVLRLNGVFALVVCLLAALAHAEVLELEGTVRSIDREARTISLAR